MLLLAMLFACEDKETGFAFPVPEETLTEETGGYEEEGLSVEDLQANGEFIAGLYHTEEIFTQYGDGTQAPQVFEVLYDGPQTLIDMDCWGDQLRRQVYGAKLRTEFACETFESPDGRILFECPLVQMAGADDNGWKMKCEQSVVGELYPEPGVYMKGYVESSFWYPNDGYNAYWNEGLYPFTVLMN